MHVQTTSTPKQVHSFVAAPDTMSRLFNGALQMLVGAGRQDSDNESNPELQDDNSSGETDVDDDEFAVHPAAPNIAAAAGANPPIPPPANLPPPATYSSSLQYILPPLEEWAAPLRLFCLEQRDACLSWQWAQRFDATLRAGRGADLLAQWWVCQTNYTPQTAIATALVDLEQQSHATPHSAAFYLLPLLRHAWSVYTTTLLDHPGVQAWCARSSTPHADHTLLQATSPAGLFSQELWIQHVMAKTPHWRSHPQWEFLLALQTKVDALHYNIILKDRIHVDAYNRKLHLYLPFQVTDPLGRQNAQHWEQWAERIQVFRTHAFAKAVLEMWIDIEKGRMLLRDAQKSIIEGLFLPFHGGADEVAQYDDALHDLVTHDSQLNPPIIQNIRDKLHTHWTNHPQMLQDVVSEWINLWYSNSVSRWQEEHPRYGHQHLALPPDIQLTPQQLSRLHAGHGVYSFIEHIQPHQRTVLNNIVGADLPPPDDAANAAPY